MDQDFGATFSGVLTDDEGRVRALWGSYAEQVRSSRSIASSCRLHMHFGPVGLQSDSLVCSPIVHDVVGETAAAAICTILILAGSVTVDLA